MRAPAPRQRLTSPSLRGRSKAARGVGWLHRQEERPGALAACERLPPRLRLQPARLPPARARSPEGLRQRELDAGLVLLDGDGARPHLALLLLPPDLRAIAAGAWSAGRLAMLAPGSWTTSATLQGKKGGS